MLLEDVAAGLGRWASSQTQSATLLVDELLREKALDVSAAQVLIEVLAADPARATWRNDVVERLSGLKDIAANELAVLLECFAWPSGAAATERHAGMMRRVVRSPLRFIPAALRALCRDARTEPAAALRTLNELLDLAEGSGVMSHAGQEVLAWSAEVLARALAGLRDRKEDEAPLTEFLRHLVGLAPGSVRRGLGLDVLLADLLTTCELAVRAFIASWLEAHHSAIVQNHETFADVLPLVAHKLGPDKEADWLLGFLVDGERPLREVAMTMLVAREGGIGDGTLSALPQGDAEIVLHELVGAAWLGERVVGTLLRIGRRFAALAPAIEEILASEIAPNYPSACVQAARQLRAEASNLALAERQALETTAARIETALRVLEQAHRLRLGVPEILRVAAATAAWSAAQQRAMDKAYRQARRRSLFSLIATTVPIGRGRESVMPWGPDPAPTPFQEHAFSMAFPAREAIDPLGERMRRLRHMQRAAELRKARRSQP